jgi:hypothetical protein
VTQWGGGNRSGTSSGNPWSIGDFNGSSRPTGGDTVTFTGTFTSTVSPAKGGTGNGAGRLTLNLTGASLTSAATRIQLNALAYVTLVGGTLGSAYSGELIRFNPNSGGQSHDITLDRWTYNGAANGIAIFLSLNHVYNLVVSNCTVSNVSGFVSGDSTLNHDIDITGCYAETSGDTTSQDDLIHIGDAANIMIEKCKLIDRSPASPVGQHNDVIQTYTKFGSYAGQPTNWVLRYNWIEMQQTSGSGDCSWLMLQSMNGDPALKVYGNVFIGTGTVGNNGMLVSRNPGGKYYLYNNTIVRHRNPLNNVRYLDTGTVYMRNNVGVADPGYSNAFISLTMAQAGTDYNFFYRLAVPSNYAGPHGSVSLDPLFTNYTGNDFSLQAGSPLRGRGDRSIGAEYAYGIARGSTWPNPTVISRSSWDIGAYVY